MASRNREKRQKRRRKRRMKPAVRTALLLASVVLLVAGLAGYKIYRNTLFIDSMGEIEAQEPVVVDESELSIENGTAKYTLFDLDGADAILIERDDVDILIDAGSKKSSKKLCEALKDRVDGDIDYLVLTSPAKGRVGGAEAIFDSFGVDTCILGDMGEKAREIRFMAQSAKETVDGADLTYDVGDRSALFILKPELSSGDQGGRSLVTYFTFGDTGFVALSDAGYEETMRAFNNVGQCDVIVLSSHGAEEPNMGVPKGEYQYCVAVADKTDDVPSENLMAHLDANYFTTGWVGSLEFTTDGASVQLKDEDKKNEILNEAAEEDDEDI